MSSLKDLFNRRILIKKRIVVLEYFGKLYSVYINKSQERAADDTAVEKIDVEDFKLSDFLKNMGITSEEIVVVIHPYHYYRNTHHFPFKERKKIEAVIKVDVEDNLPTTLSPEDMITDFYMFKDTVVSYTVPKGLVSKIISDLGDYFKNLKLLVPYEVLLNSIIQRYETVENLMYIEENPAGFEVWGFLKGSIPVYDFTGYKNGGTGGEVCRSSVMRVVKYIQPERFAVTGTSESICIRESVRVTEKLGIAEYRGEPFNRGFGRRGVYRASIDYRYREKDGINLLREEFHPGLSRYLRVKDFVVIAVLIALILSFIVGRFFVEVSSLKQRVSELNSRIAMIGDEVFNGRIHKIPDAVKLRDNLKRKTEILIKSMDRKRSALEILKEFSTVLPVDVEIEYSDIIVDTTRILFSGKAKTFSDIDRIKAAISESDRFTNVRVVNSGTTGSTGGYTVTFQISIDIKEEQE